MMGKNNPATLPHYFLTIKYFNDEMDVFNPCARV